MEKPDWLRWHAHKVATLPECVCLSLNAEPYPIHLAQPPRSSREREPTKTETRPSEQAAQFAAPIVVARMCNESTADKAQRMLNSHPALQAPEAAARYARLRAHFLDGHPLLRPSNSDDEAVTVYDFARWANAAGWTLPPELDLGDTAASNASRCHVSTETNKRSNSPTDAVAPLPRFAAQEASILAALEAASYSPLRLPKSGAGRPGVKAQIRRVLNASPLFVDGSTVFDKAWERLLKRGELSYED